MNGGSYWRLIADLIRHSFSHSYICLIYVRTIFFENAFSDRHRVNFKKSNILRFRKS